MRRQRLPAISHENLNSASKNSGERLALRGVLRSDKSCTAVTANPVCSGDVIEMRFRIVILNLIGSVDMT